MLLSVASGGALAQAATVLTCPDTQKAAGAEWARPAKSPAAGAGAWTLFEGPPADLASLAPDSDDGAKQIFVLDKDAVHWAQCRVGSGPVFERRLPAALQTCEVSYRHVSARKLSFKPTMSCS